jgi:hypothetical protein
MMRRFAQVIVRRILLTVISMPAYTIPAPSFARLFDVPFRGEL